MQRDDALRRGGILGARHDPRVDDGIVEWPHRARLRECLFRHRTAVEAEADDLGTDGAVVMLAARLHDVADGGAWQAEEAAKRQQCSRFGEEPSDLVFERAMLGAAGARVGCVETVRLRIAVAPRRPAARLYVCRLYMRVVDFIGKTSGGCFAVFRGRGSPLPSHRSRAQRRSNLMFEVGARRGADLDRERSCERRN